MNGALILGLRQAPIWTGLPANSRHIALTLAIHVTAEDPKTTLMGVEGLARHTGLSSTDVQVGLRKLIRAGVIRRWKRVPGGPVVTTFMVALPARVPALSNGTKS